MSAGVDAFLRYGFIRGRVGGENYYTAAALGKYRVHFDSSLTVLAEADGWLTQVRRACNDDNAPARYTSALRQYDRAVIEYCQRAVDAKPGRLGPILQALGRIERVLATGPVFRKDDKGRTRIPPLQGLSPQWLDQADDGSAEFRLAAALAGIPSCSGHRCRAIPCPP